MSELLHLIWISHNSKIVYNFQQLHEKQLFCDATIVCDGSYFPVHRLVLSSCSQYFEQIFEETPCKHPFIVLKDVEVEIFRDLVEFMYKGEVKIFHNKLTTFISTANSLKVQGISGFDQLKASKFTESGISNIEHLNEHSDIERDTIVAVNVPKVSKKSTSESSLPSHTKTYHAKKAGERKRVLVCSSRKPEKKIRLSQKADNEVCNDSSNTNYNGGNDIEDTETTENNDDDDEDFLTIVKTEEFHDEEIELSFSDIAKLENELNLASLPSCNKSSISLDGVRSPTNNEDTKVCVNGSTSSLTANSGEEAGRSQASGVDSSSRHRVTPPENYPATTSNENSDLQKAHGCPKHFSQFVGLYKQILKQNEDMTEEIKSLRKCVARKMTQVADVPDVSLSKLPALPLASLDEVNELEKMLEEQPQKKILVSKLTAIGGAKRSTTITNMVNHLLSKQVALQFSVKGKKKKRALFTLKLYGCLIDAVKGNTLCKHMTEHEISLAIGVALAGARDREKGRRDNSERVSPAAQGNTQGTEDVKESQGVRDHQEVKDPQCQEKPGCQG